MKKRWIVFLVGMALLCLCATACAEVIGGDCQFGKSTETFGRGNLKWSLDLSTGKLTITGSGSWGTYRPFMGIIYTPWGEAKHSDDIRSVEISEGITNIAEAAFHECKNLTSVKLPSTIKSIDCHAFQHCSSLLSINLPAAVTKVGDHAFENCTSLMTISLPGNVKNIEAFAFQGCRNLRTIGSIPSTCVEVGEGAFMNCPNLSGKLDIYGNLGKSAFRNTGLTQVTVRECTSMEEAVFAQCPKLQTAVLDCKVESLPVGAFGEDPALRSVTLPSSVASIYNEAFIECSSLSSIQLPANLNYLGDRVFKESGLVNITVPDSVTNFGTSMFESCTKLMKATLPSGLLLLPENTFYLCSSLQQVNIPAGVTLIGKMAFEECKALLKIDLPEGLLSIDEDAFYNCTALKQVTLPKSLISLGLRAFARNSSLLNVVIPKGADLSDGCFKYCTSLTGVTLPETLLTIPEEAFSNCSALTSIHVPEGVLSISPYAFINSGLTQIELPVSLTAIGHEAFYDCPLKTVQYAGSKADWEKIAIDYLNEPLLKAYDSPSESKDISAATVTSIKNQVYTGKALKPAVTVKMDGTELTKGTDYTVAYKNNKKVGKATVTITGTGAYSGTKKVTFQIVPKAVKLSSLTAGKKQMKVKWAKGSSITGYQIEYSTNKNFKSSKKLTVSKASTTKTVLKKLTSGKTWYVRIRAYKTVSGTKYYSAWSSVKSKKVK